MMIMMDYRMIRLKPSSDPATNPLSPDTDGDGICDGSIAVNNSAGICDIGPDAFPLDASASVDTDGDGMPDILNGISTSEPPVSRRFG